MNSLTISVISLSYVSFLVGLIYLQRKKIISSNIINHPLIGCLVLGVIASSWSFFGAQNLIALYGGNFLAFYLGLSCAFFISPILLQPFLQIGHKYQLNSLADILTFRFHNKLVGLITSLLLLIVTVILIVINIKDFIQIINLINENNINKQVIGIIYCLVLGLFAVSFVGNRQNTKNNKQQALILLLAGESLLKVILFGGLAIYVYVAIFDYHIPPVHFAEIKPDTFRTIMLLAFSSVIVIPYIYHVLTCNNGDTKIFDYASWFVPLYLLIVSLPVVLLLLVNYKFDLSNVFELGIRLDNLFIKGLTYVIGLTTIFTVTLVLVLASSHMLLSHVVVHVYKPIVGINIYYHLTVSKYALIILVIILSYMIYAITDIDWHANWFVPYILAIQFLPGALFGLYWQRTSGISFLIGLFFGVIVLIVGLFYSDNFQYIVWYSLLVNCCVFLGTAFIFKPNKNEQKAAIACKVDKYQFNNMRKLQAQTPTEFIEKLRVRLGAVIAIREVKMAVGELNLDLNERNSYALLRLRHKLEINLVRLFGQTIAKEIVDECLPFIDESVDNLNFSFNLLEDHLEEYQTKLFGLSAELDRLRRYQKQILHHLPVGVCSLNAQHEITLWNKAVADLTGIAAKQIRGRNIADLPEPWGELSQNFINQNDRYLFKQNINKYCINLYKANLEDKDEIILVFEDITEMQNLEHKLIHADRLASIGRLAAGVAHEIGNPVTAIACLAQNLTEDYEENEEIRYLGIQIQKQTKRITNIVHSLLGFSYAESMPNTCVSLFKITKQAIELLQLNPNEQQVNFYNECDENHVVFGNEQKLLQVIINLLDNARFASHKNGDIWIKTKQIDNFIELKITDEGTGIDAEIIPKLFEPFFTTKQAGRGTGLGLALTYTIIQEHKGEINIISPSNMVTNRGTCICIKLPCN